MMRVLWRLSVAMKRAGIVLLCFAVAFTIFGTASVGPAYRKVKEAYRQSVPDTGENSFVLWSKVFGDYFRGKGDAALAQKKSSAAQKALLKEAFADIAGEALAAEQAVKSVQANIIWEWFSNHFDADTFVKLQETAEDKQEAIAADKVVAYLDSLTVKPAKGKLAGLEAASVGPFFVEAYQGFKLNYGEEAGTYLEFLEVVQQMLDAFVAEGGSVKDAKSWYTANFDEGDKTTLPEAYQEALETVRGMEREELEASLITRLEDVVEEKGDVKAFIQEVWEEVQEAAPTLEEGFYLVAIQEAVYDTGFDGTLGSLIKRIQEKQKADQTPSFEAFLDGYAGELLEEVETVPARKASGLFWLVVGNVRLLWLLGFGLIVLGLLLGRLTRFLLLKTVPQEKVADSDVLLEVRQLCQFFRSGSFVNKAVNEVSFTVKRGEVFGLVGESGCGKTTTGRTIIGLYPATAGDVFFEGKRICSTKLALPVALGALRQDYAQEVEKLKEERNLANQLHPEQKAEWKRTYKEKKRAARRELTEKMKQARNLALETDAQVQHDGGEKVARKIQMIFQDPISSIDPRMTVREVIAEGLKIQGEKDKAKIEKEVTEMLNLVGLLPEHLDRYPHEFSGGQRQRIGIARALVMRPEMVIADEPVSALDVSVQAQVINLLNDLRERMGLTILFIAHNLSVVKYFSDRIAVMYYGRIVEMATSDELFAHPLHPYTKSLLSAIPVPDPITEKNRKRRQYKPVKEHDYSQQKPSLREITPGHFIDCNDEEFARYRKELGL